MLWIDLEDVIQYFLTGHRPSGIQRLSFELACALTEIGGDAVRVCRHASGGHGFVELDWPATRARLRRLMSQPRMPAGAQTAGGAPAPVTPLPRRWLRRLPADLRIPLAAAYQAERRAVAGLGQAALVQVEALRALRTLLANGWRHARKSSAVAGADERNAVAGPAAGGPARFMPGDLLLSIGATWQFPDYAGRVDAIRALGVRFVPFVHDMVPILFPEWSVPSTSRAFRRWVETVLARADLLLTNSRATARDVARHARAADLPIPAALPIPIGAAFPHPADAAAPPLHPSPYVLFVSTIEPRKNHGGMLRLWRELIRTEPAGLVPDLVLAGRVGWLAGDIVAQAGNAGWFGGKLRLIESPTDAELAVLYRDCLFTIYPSFYEGWGLPVTESLWFGKPVVAADRASIPEAGGEFCVYFDPDDLGDARRAIAGLIRDPARRAALEAAIAERFSPPSWHDSARALLRELAAPVAAVAPAPVMATAAGARSSPTG